MAIDRMNDGIDMAIATILQSNARTSNADIARQVGMAPSAILERIRKLEQRGVIKGYEARIDPGALGLGLLAYVAVRTDERAGDECAGERLARIPEVQEVHHVAGEDCYLLKVRVKGVEPVRATRTTVVLDTLRETSLLPLNAAEEEEPTHE